MKAEPLSPLLSKLASKRFLSLTHRNEDRLDKLLKTSRQNPEYALIKRFIRWRKRTDRRMHIVAVEYRINDGVKDGYGDLILCDGTTLFVVECKCVIKWKSRSVRRKRNRHVREQAMRYTNRLKSWFSHLGTMGEVVAMPLVAAVLTDEYSDIKIVSDICF